MAISFVDAEAAETQSAAASNITATGTLPTGHAANDALLMAVSSCRGTTESLVSDATSQGWTLAQTVSDGAETTRYYWKVDGGSESAPVAVFTNANAVIHSIITQIVAYRGTDSSTPILLEAQSTETGSGGPTTHTGATLNNTDAAAWGVFLATARQVATPQSWTPGTGLTERLDTDAGIGTANNHWAALNDTNGVLATGNWTPDGTTSTGTNVATSWTVLLKPSTGGGGTGGYIVQEDGTSKILLESSGAIVSEDFVAGDYNGTATVPLTGTIASTGVVGKVADSTVGLTGTIASTGVVGKSSTASVPLTDTISSAGVVGKVAGVSVAIAVAITATGVVGKATGSSVTENVAISSTGTMAAGQGSTLAESIAISSTGVVGKNVGASLPLNVAITAEGVVGKQAGASIPLGIAINSGGAVVSGVTGTANIGLTDTITSAGVVGKATGASVPLTDTIASTGVVGKRVGSSIPLTDTINSTGVVGKATGSSVPLTDTITSAGIVGKAVGASLPIDVAITADGVVAGSPGQVVIPLNFDIDAEGSVGVFKGASLPATFLVTSTGAVGKQTASSIPVTVTVVSAGHVGKQAAVNLAPIVTITADGFVGLSDSTSIPITVDIDAEGAIGFTNSADIPLMVAITADGTVRDRPLPETACDPRAALAHNGDRARMAQNPHDADLVCNPHDAYLICHRGGEVDVYTQGDTKPDYTAVLLDGGLPFDASTADSVDVKVWRDGVQIADRAAVALPDGTVTMPWSAGDLDEPGPLLSKIVVTSGGNIQTFPPKSFLKTLVSPQAP